MNHPRPPEPRCSNEDPEAWAAIAQWESDRADEAEEALAKATVPLCVGKPIIGILAQEGAYQSESGQALVAADCLFRKNPYEEIERLKARILEPEA